VREGMKFLKSEEVGGMDFDSVVRRLEECCDAYGGSCDGCPDKVKCVSTFDRRASMEGKPVPVKIH